MRPIKVLDPNQREWTVTTSLEIVTLAERDAAIAQTPMTEEQAHRASRRRGPRIGRVYGIPRSDAWMKERTQVTMIHARCGDEQRSWISPFVKERDVRAHAEGLAAQIERGELPD